MAQAAVRKMQQQLSQLIRNRKVLGSASLATADIAAKAIALAITPYIANRMGAASFGTLNLYLSATEIIAFALFLGGPALVTAEYVREGYTSARGLRAASIHWSLQVAVVLLVASALISSGAPHSLPLAIGALIIIVSYVQGLNTLELAYYRGAQEYRVAVIGQFSFAVLNVAFTVVAFEIYKATAANRLLAIALAGGLVQLAYAIELRRKYYQTPDRSTQQANRSLIISFGLSISAYVISQWVRSSVDRFVLTAYAGVSAAGIYSVALTSVTVPAIFFSIINQQLQPYLYRRLKERNFGGFRRIQFWIVFLVACVMPFYYWVLIAFFDRIFDPQYQPAKALIPALLGASMAQSMYHIFTHAAFYERRGNYISSLTALGLVTHLLGLGTLAALGQVTPSRVALVYLLSSSAVTLGMAFLSQRTVSHLAKREELPN